VFLSDSEKEPIISQINYTWQSVEIATLKWAIAVEAGDC